MEEEEVWLAKSLEREKMVAKDWKRTTSS